jgi:hypothetical protein
VRGQRHAPAAPYPQERHGTHCTGGWVGLRAGRDRCGKSPPTGIRSPDRPARRQSLYRLRYPAHPCSNQTRLNSARCFIDLMGEEDITALTQVSFYFCRKSGLKNVKMRPFAGSKAKFLVFEESKRPRLHRHRLL